MKDAFNLRMCLENKGDGEVVPGTKLHFWLPFVIVTPYCFPYLKCAPPHVARPTSICKNAQLATCCQTVQDTNKYIFVVTAT